MKTFADRRKSNRSFEPTVGQDKAMDRIAFLRKHPEFSENTGILINTVMCCDDYAPNILQVTLEDAHTHVFGASSDSGCIWCKKNYELSKAERERLLD